MQSLKSKSVFIIAGIFFLSLFLGGIFWFSSTAQNQCVEYLDNNQICIREKDYLKDKLLVVFKRERDTSYQEAADFMTQKGLGVKNEVCQADVCEPAEIFYRINYALLIEVPTGQEKVWLKTLQNSPLIQSVKRITDLTLARFYNPAP